MASTAMSAALRHLNTIYAGGSVLGLTDADLLERFATRRDEPAFAAIVARHGPMVLGVARSVLRDEHLAEDAFQATFLILARRARGIRRGEVLAGWLHRVAHRVAVEASTRAARHRQVERQAVDAGLIPRRNAPLDRPEPVLHEELARLPDRFRLPVVLCHLEGLTHAQAAARLRLGEATIRRRLSGAKKLLRSRLTRRGVVPGALVAGLGALRPASAALPESLIRSALRAATAAGTVPPAVTALASAITKGMLMTRLATLSAVLLTATAVGGVGYGVLADVTDTSFSAPESPQPIPQSAPPRDVDTPNPPEVAGAQTLRGRVVDPDGKPVAGAEIYLGGNPFPDGPMVPAPELRATSDDEGRFQFEVADAEAGGAAGSWFGLPLAALADGYGPAWVMFDPAANEDGAEWTLRLAPDDVPITGRLLDLEGRPVPDATVRVNNLMRPEDGDLAKLLDDLRANAGRQNPDLWGRLRNRLFLGNRGVIPEVATDAEGRFRIEGIGRDRIAVLLVGAEPIETTHALVLTTSDPDYEPVAMPEGGSGELQGPDVLITAPPGRVVEGVVRDRDSGAPIAGILVEGHFTAQATTDDAGRYRLTGLPATMPVRLRIVPGELPYFAVEATTPSPAGLAPTAVDFELKRGVQVEGRVVDAETGGAVVGALVSYFPMRDNPHLEDVPGWVLRNNTIGDEPAIRSDSEGRFRLTALPGGGLIAVRSADRAFLTAEPLDPQVAANVLRGTNVPFQADGFEGLAPIELPDDAKSFTSEIALRPGRSLRVEVVGPEGEPISGEIRVQTPNGSETLSSGSHDYVHPRPGQVETLVFHSTDQDLGGILELSGQEEGSVRFELEPTGTLTGRLVDEDGRPRAGVDLQVLCDTSRGMSSQPHVVPNVSTDSEGRFRIGKLVPGLKYQILALKPRPQRRVTFDAEGYIAAGPAWWGVDSGEVRDWGDVEVMRIGDN